MKSKNRHRTPRTLALFLAIAVLIHCRAEAADSAAKFLTISPSPVYAALAVRGTAVINDVNALFLNPGGLSGMDKGQLTATHTELFEDSSYNALGVGFPMTERRGTLALGAVYLKKGTIQGRDATGLPTGGFSADDMAVSLGYGRSVGRVSIGSALKMVRQRIDRFSANAVALDLGAQMPMGRFQLGGSINNLGSSVRFISAKESLPLSGSLGIGTQIGGFNLMADSTTFLKESRTKFGLGASLSLGGLLSLRSGYAFGNAISAAGSGSTGQQFSSFAGFTAGLGFAIQRFNIDYALVPHSELPASHQFSLLMRY